MKPGHALLAVPAYVVWSLAMPERAAMRCMTGLLVMLTVLARRAQVDPLGTLGEELISTLRLGAWLQGVSHSAASLTAERWF